MLRIYARPVNFSHRPTLQTQNYLFYDRHYGSIFIHLYTQRALGKLMTVVQGHLMSHELVPI